MRYLCLVYQNEELLARLSASEYAALVEEALAHTAALQASGHLIAANALQPVHSATSLRLRDGRVSITDGPFVETKEFLGGYLLIEARDLNDAIRLASQFPPARFGGIEVRPVRELPGSAPATNCTEHPAGTHTPEHS